MRSRVCLALAWLVLFGALAVGNPWLPPRHAALALDPAVADPAGLGRPAERSVAPNGDRSGRGVGETEAQAGAAAHDSAIESPVDPEVEAGAALTPRTGN